jgi:hypothetical protein
MNDHVILCVDRSPSEFTRDILDESHRPFALEQDLDPQTLRKPPFEPIHLAAIPFRLGFALVAKESVFSDVPGIDGYNSDISIHLSPP